ncbi:MAG TPA: tRNA (cytidine(56)-2'-O)-methyltransferase [Methanothermococcus okinawensis]|uniref:tRNA (cytidine(56)-2'-O)-methyltransferase n=1 Tax=Methanothermococcus okinawensis TaxID=155863 RepID=A0A832ZBL0_9EURY|nr:tRNA (cytidine(56)-2'-O)-methyltransferase [Methanococcaceae archaeon]HIP84703.1 tRNA (cytidine(56)-2'-O)-methyltransferase [Methanothermococcus okinawensis]HIP91336.1 tRNA (cytidine(56)-2'-O)-methyltransferase [Methanothermococcus okinawensis]
MVVEVLRLGHRGERDKRVSTHVALTARALGADKILFTCEDKHVRESIDKVVENWGGDFKFEVVESWKRYVRDFKSRGVVVHLTMYGESVNERIDTIREFLKRGKDILVVIGGEKVPKEIYQLADYNISIGNQPHSEVAALAIFLDRLFEGKTLYRDYPDGKIKVIPSERRKTVVKKI